MNIFAVCASMWFFAAFWLVAQAMEQSNRHFTSSERANNSILLALEFQEMGNYTLEQFVKICTCPEDTSASTESIVAQQKQRMIECESLKFILRERTAAYNMQKTTLHHETNDKSTSKSFWNTLKDAIADNRAYSVSENAFKCRKFITLLLSNVYWHFKFQAECILRLLPTITHFKTTENSETQPKNSSEFMLHFMQTQMHLKQVESQFHIPFTHHILSMERSIEIAAMLLGTNNQPTFNTSQLKSLSKDLSVQSSCLSFHHYTNFKHTSQAPAKECMNAFALILEPLNNASLNTNNDIHRIDEPVAIGRGVEFIFRILLSDSKAPLIHFIRPEQWIVFLQGIGNVHEAEDKRFGWFCSTDSVIRMKYDLQNMQVIWPAVWKAALQQCRITGSTIAEIGSLVKQRSMNVD